MRRPRGSDEHGDELPTRDGVADALARSDERAAGAAPVAGLDRDVELELVTFRPTFRRVVAHVATALGVVGMLLLVPFATLTPLGQQALGDRGALGLAGGWVAMIVIIVAGALAGLAVARALSSTIRRVRRVEVLRLALGDAAVAAAGATFAAALVSGALNDLVRVLALAFALTFCFTWAMLLPLYRRAWDAAAEHRD